MKAFAIIYSFGQNTHAELGHGSTGKRRYPVSLANMRHVSVISVESGADHTLALTDEGKVYVWGSDNFGEVLSKFILT
jgi:alpha-tubulin suppressor-like RCC1 family protein